MKENAPDPYGSKNPDKLRETLQKRIKKFRSSKHRWCKLYYVSLYGSVVAAASSALILKLEAFTGVWKQDLAATLATFGAIMGSVMAAGRFEQRWRAARRAECEARLLEHEFDHEGLATEELSRKLRDVIQRYDAEMIDEEPKTVITPGETDVKQG
jgi:uncharacterized membrane protein YccC